jgi:AcrR family transcriptional regulator
MGYNFVQMANPTTPRANRPNPDGPLTRGGWVPAGTAAARRERQDEHGTDRGRAARAHLVKAARIVFERDGYLAARVEDIVAEAQVARGSFYTYFPSKKEVFRELSADVAAEVQRAVRYKDAGIDDVFASLDESNRRFLSVYRANSAFLALIEQVSTVDPEIHDVRLRTRQAHVRRVERSIRRWQLAGLADDTIDPASTAGALVSMLSNFAYWWLAGGDEYDDELATTTLTDIWARAVGLRRDHNAPAQPTDQSAVY